MLFDRVFSGGTGHNDNLCQVRKNVDLSEKNALLEANRLSHLLTYKKTLSFPSTVESQLFVTWGRGKGT